MTSIKKIKKTAIKHWPLIIVLAMAAILRLWKLSSIPPHLTPDEASLGYNAYSILKTGRDEYGQLLPIIFKSFGDYKPGLYIYLTVPLVAFFGLNEFSVRLTSALAGILAVWLFYCIVAVFFKDRKLAIKHQTLAFLAGLFLAISPWHIQFSRGAWEVNLSLTLTLAGVYFFLKSLRAQKYLLLSAVFFSLTYISYQGAKLSTTIVIFILALVYWKQVLKIDKKVIAKSILTGLLICMPIILSFAQGKTGRLGVFSVFSYPRPEQYLQSFLDQGEEKVGDLSYYLFHPESLNFTRGILGRWFNHFSGRFLFFEGDWQNPRHSVPNHGMLLLADLVFSIIGFSALVRLKSKPSTLMLLWLILAPLPAVLSRDQVHAVRAYNLVIPLTLISALGLYRLVGWINSQRKNLILHSSFYLLLILIFLGSIICYLDAYFVHLPKHDSVYWEYGYKQIVEAVTPIQSQYKTVKVQQSYAQPYIYFLFYQKYDPVKYQGQAKLVESEIGDVGQVERLDNIYFAPIDWSVNRGEEETLFVADTIRIPVEDSSDPEKFNLIKEINYLDGRTAFRIIENR